MRCDDAWSRYWSDGRAVACGNAADGDYFPAIRETWRRFFARLRDGDRLLDIATGNGAVPRLAIDYATDTDLSLEVVGVDRAELAPGTLPEQAEAAGQSLQLLGRTAAEDLPFADDSFDVVTSQYALEYTDTRATLDECARVLRAGGQLMAVVHTQDSGVMDHTRLELDDCRVVLDEARLLDRYDDLLGVEVHDGALDPSRQQSAAYAAAKQAFDAAAQRCLARTRDRPAERWPFLRDLLLSMAEIYQHRHAHPLSVVLDRVATIRAEVTAHRQRLQDMNDAALYRDQLAALATALEQRDFEIAANEAVVDEQGGRYGQAVRAVAG